MSRGFVKEDDLELAGTDVAERPISQETNYVTPTGLAQLQSQADILEKTHFALVPNKENPIIQQRLGSIERDLRYVQARLENALLIDPTSQSKATTVKIPFA